MLQVSSNVIVKTYPRGAGTAAVSIIIVMTTIVLVVIVVIIVIKQ